MNDELTGEEFGGALERLRQAARIDLPKLADEYAIVRDKCDESTALDSKLDHDAYFGATQLKTQLTQLRDLVWTAAGESGDNIWALSGGLSGAVDDFATEDTAGGDEMERSRRKLQQDGDRTNDEWRAGYDKGKTPEWKQPG